MKAARVLSKRKAMRFRGTGAPPAITGALCPPMVEATRGVNDAGEEEEEGVEVEEEGVEEATAVSRRRTASESAAA